MRSKEQIESRREANSRQRERRREREKGLTMQEVYALRKANGIAHNSGDGAGKGAFALHKAKIGTVRSSVRRKRLIQVSGCQNHRCCYCGQQTWHPDIIDCGTIPHTKWNHATSEHVVARTHGGTWGKYNITMACYECNGMRGSMDVKKFIALITGNAKHKPGKKEMRALKKEEKRKSEKGQHKKLKTLRLMCVALMFYSDLFDVVLEESKTMPHKDSLKINKRCQLTAIRRRVIENQMVY